VTETIPLWLVTWLSFITVFSVMASIGTTITPSTCLDHLRAPSPLIRGLVSVLLIVPIVGIATSYAFGLDLVEKVGVVLIAIAPGAPLALRRALSSGADVGFAATLQIVVAMLAVPLVPLWVIVANAILGTHGIADAGSIATQVFLAQLLPLSMGTVVKRLAPVMGPWIGTVLGRTAAILLIAVLVSIIVDVRYSILATHHWPIAVAAVTTTAALSVGHLIGGPSPQIRHSTAIAGAMRNVGLALLIATINHMPPTVGVIIISYAITTILIVMAYIWWLAHITTLEHTKGTKE
jgi:BASS family bile acid:Na+ symporter